MTTQTTIRVGTASWTDPGFIADWYPKGLSTRKRLAWYAEQFNLDEVNSSFYAVPRAEVVARWSEQTPDDFLFDVKLHRLLSRHSTKIDLLPRGLRALAKNGSGKAKLTPKLETELVDAILEAVEPLKKAGKLGAFLLQMTPSFGTKHHSLDELGHVIELMKGYRLAVELRNSGWVDEEHFDDTIKFFKKRHVALVAVDSPVGSHFMIMPGVDIVTDRQLAYLRAHGRNRKGYVSGRTVAERFDHDYSNAELKEIAGRVKDLARGADEVHVVFNNNKSSYAPEAAARFRRIVQPLAASAKPQAAQSGA
jgi:uncharacterized protein YecE (DUF72 family)